MESLYEYWRSSAGPTPFEFGYSEGTNGKSVGSQFSRGSGSRSNIIYSHFLRKRRSGILPERLGSLVLLGVFSSY